MKKIALSFAVAAALASSFANAADDALPTALDVAVKQAGMKVVNKFPAAGGLQGWVLQQNGQNNVVYTTPDGKHLIAGALLDASGQNLTAQYTEKYSPKRDFEALMPQLEKAPYIVAGAKGNAAKSTIYVMFDANCPYCQASYKALKPYEAAGLQVRWVPVAYLRPDSHTKAAALLEATNPEAALFEHEMGAGIKPVDKVSDATAKKLSANEALMQSFGFTGTPAIIYRDKSGKVVTKNGMPRLGELPGITGLPEQKIDDPSLARFR